MAREAFEMVPGEVTQTEWDAKYDATTKALKDMGGANSKDSDDLPEGTANKYDTGAPPTTTDGLTEGTVNKYDTGEPPTDLEDLPDGTTRKAMSGAEKTKLTDIDAGAEVNPTGGEMRDAIVAIPEADRKIVVTEPLTGNHKIYEVHLNPAGNIAGNSESVAES